MRPISSSFLCAVSFAGLLAALAGCGAPVTDNKKTVVFGAVLDRTGINSELSWGDAVALAQAHVNSALTEAGYKNMAFKVPIRDSAGLADVAIAESTKVVTQDKAIAVMLGTSDEDLAVHKLYYDADVSNDLKVPLMCASCTSSAINSPAATASDPVQQLAWRNSEKWNHRSIMSTKLIAKILARMILAAGDVTGDGKLKLSFYAVNDTFGTGALKDVDTEIKAQLATSGFSKPYVLEKVLHPREVDTNSYSWAGDVAKLVDTYNETTMLNDGVPDVVVSANLVLQESAFTRAYNESGTTVPNLHMHTMRASSALRSIAQLAEGQVGVSHLNVESNASGAVFKSDYETAFGTPIVYRDAIYYDGAMKVLLGALKASMTVDDPSTLTGAQVRDGIVDNATSASAGTVIRTGKNEIIKAISEMQAGRPINYEGASGPVDDDANYNVTSKLVRYRVVNGVFVDEAVYDCVASTDCPQVSGQ